MNTLPYSVAYSFGGKRNLDFGEPERLKSSQVVPGPGNYKEVNFEKVGEFSKIQTYTFSKEAKLRDARSMSPGPGSYAHVSSEVIRQKGPIYSVSKTERLKDLFLNVEDGSQFNMKSSDRVRSDYPGPGNYEVEKGISKVKPRSRSVVVERTKKDVDYNNRIPGPGEYDNDTIRVKQTNPKWSVSKKNREDPFLPENYKKEIEKVPGPGNYNLQSGIGDGRKVTHFY